MAKIAFSKLGIKLNDTVNTVEYNGLNIEVKQYLPIDDKTALIERLVNMALSLDRTNYNPVMIEVYKKIAIIEYYTNLTFTQTQKDNVLKLYDLLESSGLNGQIFQAIPETELNMIQDLLKEGLNSIYSYYNSIRGVLTDISADYNNLQFDINSLKNDLTENSQEILALKDIITDN